MWLSATIKWNRPWALALRITGVYTLIFEMKYISRSIGHSRSSSARFVILPHLSGVCSFAFHKTSYPIGYYCRICTISSGSKQLGPITISSSPYIYASSLLSISFLPVFLTLLSMHPVCFYPNRAPPFPRLAATSVSNLNFQNLRKITKNVRGIRQGMGLPPKQLMNAACDRLVRFC